MKTFYQVNCFLACFILASTVLYSCQNEDIQNENTLNSTESDSSLSTVNALNAIVSTNSILEDYIDCSSVCIEEDSETYFAMTGSDTGSAGPNSKSVSYEAYNTETQLIINVTYTITSGNSNAQADITITIDGDEAVIEDVPSGSTVSHMIDLPSDWEACDEIPFTIYQEGLSNPISFNETYALIGMCGGCDESFDYEEQEDGSYLFTYTSAESLEGAEVKLTCPHIVDFEALDGKVYSFNPGNGQGSPTVLTWTGDIDACTEISFAISFTADCDQNNSGFANVFTDFKVNGVSKKGELSNIKFDCSED
ncbi:hypothetical protein [Mangrovimonas aestuarii]|uniref:hypothetical protein n=1 Tax=Mangrovimonas aestuarii TaxID=3018443 RepID=UPI002378D95C|nr:hypothetical protein [Mangrovimonas aestuarii]